jgi:hypothetical protein
MARGILPEKVVQARKGWANKKCGAENGDPNRHSQPRLPGSVVGEASMRLQPQTAQDYEGKCPLGLPSVGASAA